MNAIKKVRKHIAANPGLESSQILTRLVVAVETEQNFNLGQLYQLDYELFETALALLKEWRLDRYYTAKGQLLDITLQVSEGSH